MALTLGDRTLYRLSVDDVMTMLDTRASSRRSTTGFCRCGCLRADTGVKPALYAAAGVPDYWVVDVAGRRLEVRRDPVGEEYRRLEVLGPGQVISPLALELPAVGLDDLL
jgi:hypothetical protein